LEWADAFDNGEISKIGGGSTETTIEPNTNDGGRCRGENKSVCSTTEKVEQPLI
jgi:hypothetical protein